MAVLDYSSHVVTVDRQRHIVAERTVALADAAEPSEPVAKVVSLPRSVGRSREHMA